MDKKRKIIAIGLSVVVLGALGTGGYFIWYTLYEPNEEDIAEFLHNSREILRGAGDQYVNTSGKNVKIFFMLGQSQMVGFGRYDEYPEEMRLERENVLRLEDEGWVMQKPREMYSGPEISFANEMIQHDNDTIIGIIKVAIGGIGIRTFIPDWTWNGAQLTGDGKIGPLYRIIEEKIEQVKTICNVEFVGIMWKQGESDMLARKAAEGYVNQLTAITEEIRKDTGVADLPLFVATYANNSMLAELGYTNRQIEERKYGRVVIEALADSENVISNTTVVAHGNLPLVSDNLHFSTAGLVTLGKMFANTYINIA
ncbi:MAG: sialate O-acetylesterase [Promethearchaeota archaeon]